ncbi:hypothetical protein ANN_26089 [Periplaneta americana]|uniref:Tc1-like transposase DDE domain-containing protein n=1 Tax=Periplaneta americana TaxID=6978 RepID=A0ABQ8S4Y6_PERAM|nr:hypothetical protein ANN_26089 [Periplaneta americana]
MEWTDRIRNEVVLERVGEGRIMLKLIRMRKTNWPDHWLRRNYLLKSEGCTGRNGERFLQHHLRPALRRKRRHVGVQNPIILHDNAKSHTAAAVKDLLRRWEWEILEHPPYSPDMIHAITIFHQSERTTARDPFSSRNRNIRNLESLPQWKDVHPGCPMGIEPSSSINILMLQVILNLLSGDRGAERRKRVTRVEPTELFAHAPQHNLLSRNIVLFPSLRTSSVDLEQQPQGSNYGEITPPRRKKLDLCKVEVDDFDQHVIRDTIEEFYGVQKVVPTIKRIIPNG